MQSEQSNDMIANLTVSQKEGLSSSVFWSRMFASSSSNKTGPPPGLCRFRRFLTKSAYGPPLLELFDIPSSASIEMQVDCWCVILEFEELFRIVSFSSSLSRAGFGCFEWGRTWSCEGTLRSWTWIALSKTSADDWLEHLNRIKQEEGSTASSNMFQNVDNPCPVFEIKL